MKKRCNVAAIILLLSFTLVNAFSVESSFAGCEDLDTDWPYNADYGLDRHTIFEYKNIDDTDCVDTYLNDYANALDAVAMAGQARKSEQNGWKST